MLLTGTFTRSIDEKLRVAIPKRLRESLECARGGCLFVAPGTDRSLAIYTEEAFEHVADRLSRASPTGQEVRAFTRLFYGRAQRVELDGQGRIRIPVELAELAELSKDAVLLGVGFGALPADPFGSSSQNNDFLIKKHKAIVSLLKPKTSVGFLVI